MTREEIYDIIYNKGKYVISEHDPVIDMLYQKFEEEYSKRFNSDHAPLYSYNEKTKVMTRLDHKQALIEARIEEHQKYLTYICQPENLAGFLIRQEEAKKFEKLVEFRIAQLNKERRITNAK